MIKSSTSNNTKGLFLIILFSSTLVLSAIFITFTLVPSLSPFSDKKGRGISIKKVYTSIPSSDGKSHSIAADFYIVSSKKDVADADAKELQAAILKIIPTLDYDKITTKGGTDYLTQSIKKDLHSLSKNEWIDEVYISNLLLDVGISRAENEKGNTIEKAFKGN